jgi:hypothetical protein
MSQPLGSHGGEPNQPAQPHRSGPSPQPGTPRPYEPRPPHGPPSYGPPHHGRPGHPPQGPYGGPPPRPKRNLLPWLIVGGALLIFGLGLLLVLVLTRDEGTRTQSAGSLSSSPSSSVRSGREAATWNLPGGARGAASTGTRQGAYAGSGEVALGWVQAMADGDFQTAYDLSCGEVQQAAASVAEGGDPAWALATSFFEHTLGGAGFSESSFDGVEHSADSDSDVVSFTLRLDNGEEFLLLVYVDPAQSVCDFR